MTQDHTNENAEPRQTEEAPVEKDLISQAFFRDKNVADEDQRPGDRFKTIAFKSLLFLIPLFVLVWVVDAAVQRYLPPEKILPYMQKEIAFYTLKVEQFQQMPLPDVVVIGSSRARNGVNAKQLTDDLSRYWGRPARAFNLGLDGAMMAEFRSLLSSRMPDPPPPYVVLCVSGQEVVQFKNFFFAPRFLWSAPDLFDYLSRVTFEEFSSTSVEYYIESVICRFWYIFKHRDALKEMCKEKAGILFGIKSFEDSEKNRLSPHRMKELRNLILSEYGFEPEEHRGMNLEERLKKNPKSMPPVTKRRLEKDAALFEKTDIEGLVGSAVEYARRNGSKIILVECPPSPYDQKQRSVLSGAGFRQWMTDLAKKLDVPFIPMPAEETALTNDLYEDASHLSPDGANKYTRLMFEKLRDSGFLDQKTR